MGDEVSGERGTDSRPRAGRGAPVLRLILAALVVIAALVIAACGGDDDGSDGPTGDSEAFPPSVVSQEEIDATEEGTPERALLEWWQSFQFGDPGAVIPLTSQETLDAVGEEELSELVSTRGQGLQGIEVLGSSESDDTASVRVGLLTFQPEKEGEPPPDEPTASRPDTFAMVNEDDEWKFAETAYLEPQIASLEEAQKAEEQPQEEQPEEEQPQDEGQAADEEGNR